MSALYINCKKFREPLPEDNGYVKHHYLEVCDCVDTSRRDFRPEEMILEVGEALDTVLDIDLSIGELFSDIDFDKDGLIIARNHYVEELGFGGLGLEELGHIPPGLFREYEIYPKGDGQIHKVKLKPEYRSTKTSKVEMGLAIDNVPYLGFLAQTRGSGMCRDFYALFKVFQTNPFEDMD